MRATASTMVSIIADDLTGACDTGCLFAGSGPVGVVVEPVLPSADRPVIAVDTESRPLAPDEAARVVRAVAARLKPRLGGVVFKKIDSTLRGAVGAELTALLEGGPFAGALVCPAFPAQRRVVRHGRLLVDSVPVHESPFGRDPAFRAATSEIAALLAAGAPVVPLGLDDVRAGREKIAHILEQHRGAIVAADAETDADLASLAEALGAVPGTLAAGSAGLGRALSRALGLAGPAVTLPPGAARLVVVGSLHPASRAQLGALTRAGMAGVTADGDGHTDEATAVAALAGGRPAFVASVTAPAARDAVARQVAQAAGRVIERASPDLVMVTGGETAYALIQALRPDRFDLLGAPADGLALGRLTLAGGRQIPLLTKAGGFGAAGFFSSLLGGAS
ncbi:MAG: four-carbon acid sugar kinase family protein [Candidatus Rokuibacteriota bacterium]